MELEKLLESINKKLNTILQSQRKETWVPGKWIKSLTGWDGEKMRQAREDGLIEFRRNGEGSFEYKVESVPQSFIKNQTVQA